MQFGYWYVSPGCVLKVVETGIICWTFAGVPPELTVSAALRASCPGAPLLAVLGVACAAVRVTRPEAIGGATVAETLKIHAPHVAAGAMALVAVAAVTALTDDVVRAVLRTSEIGRAKTE